MTRRPLSPTELKRLHRHWRRHTALRLGLILDGVQNPYNVGALLRSAAAYGVETVWAAAPTPGSGHPGVRKTALGSGRFVRWVEVESGPAAVRLAADAGLVTIGVELCAGAEPLHAVEAGSAVCLVLGHEDRGIHRQTLELVDRVGYLPQLGKVGSLNVAHAGTVALYEIARQAWAATPPPSPTTGDPTRP